MTDKAVSKLADASNKFHDAMINQGLVSPFHVRRTRGRRSFVNQIMDDFDECWKETDYPFPKRPSFFKSFESQLRDKETNDKIAINVIRGSAHMHTPIFKPERFKDE